MSSPTPLHHAARRSLASVILAAVAIAVNHLYSLGPAALLLGGVLVVLPTALLLWFRRSQSRVALLAYAAVSAWIVLGFGAYKGLWRGVFRLFVGTGLAAISTSFPKPTIGSYEFEASGILMFVAALFVAYYGLELLRAAFATTGDAPAVREPNVAVSPRRWAYASVAGTLGVISVGLFALQDRDAFVPPVNDVVTIGVIAPVTGPYAILGNSFVKAVQMALDDLRGTRYRYVLRIEDSGPDPAKARSHVKQVVEDDRVDAVIGAVSLIGQVTKPFATNARIPHLCVCTVATIGDGAYNFTNIPSPEAEAVAWVAEAERRRIRTIAIVQQDYPSINNHVKAMKAEAARRGLRIAYDARYADSVMDFRTIIGEAKRAHADVYYVEALEPQLDVLAQQLADSGVRNIASVVAPSLSVKPWLFNGAWYTDSDLSDMAFKRRFEAKYPGTQFATHMMPYAYDSFNMIVRAYEQGVNPAVYIRNVRSYVGVAGRVTKAPGSGNFASAPTVWTITNGAPLLLRDALGSTRTERADP
jgi:ABC-type branched-subunit amino acid transport system substrate-binding protein